MSAEAADVMDIQLNKGPNGLGFNIRGGTDNEHRSDDPGIFVTTVREKGAAAEDGRLQPGDKIIEVNGVDVTMVKHYEAVQAFHSAKDIVNLRVVRNPYPDDLESTRTGDQVQSSSLWPYFIVGGLIGIGGYFVWRRFQ